MVNYIKLFSGHALNIVPGLTEECAKDSVWYILSDFIRSNYSQDTIKAGYLLVLDSYQAYCLSEDKDENTFKVYSLHMDILWQALSDENCAKIELHIRL